MSFLIQNLDFLFEEPYGLESKPLGYLTIVVVAVLAFFVFVPKGDKKLSPASEITTDKAVEMRGIIGGDDRIIAHIPAGSALKIYATIGEDELWAEDIHGNRGAVPVSLLGDRYFLLDDEKLGETMYKKGTEVTLLEKVDEFHYKVRTDDGTVGETNYPGRIIFNAGALGLPDKHRNTYHIAFTKFMETFQAGKPMDEIEGHPLYAESIKNEGGRLIADYEYAVFSDEADSVYVGVRAVFADGVLESVETGTVKTKPYTVALRILPFTEALMGLPVIRDLSWHKPVAKTYAESQKDIAKSINIDNIKPRFISVILKIIILVLLLGLLIYTVIDLLLFVPMLLYPLLYIPLVPNIFFQLLALCMVFVSTEVLFVAFGPFIGGNSVGDMAKLWFLIVLFVANCYIVVKMTGFIRYNRCHACGRMNALVITDSRHTGTSYTDTTTSKVTKIGDREVDREKIKTDHYKTRSFKNYLRCRKCGREFALSESVTRKIGTTYHKH